MSLRDTDREPGNAPPRSRAFDVGVAGTLARLIATARGGGLDDMAVLFALVAARRRAAELEYSGLALIETARDGTPEAAATAR